MMLWIKAYTTGIWALIRLCITKHINITRIYPMNTLRMIAEERYKRYEREKKTR